MNEQLVANKYTYLGETDKFLKWLTALKCSQKEINHLYSPMLIKQIEFVV